MAIDNESLSTGMTGPAMDAAELDLSTDDAEFSCSRAVFVGVGGDIKVRMRSGAIVTFRNVVAGCERPWQINKVFKDGTSAAGLVALW